MTEYGSIHTDWSRSGGQPKQSYIFEACDVQKHTLIVDQDYASHTVKVKSLDDSQPTQSDALREENERLRALLARTVNLAEVYAEGTGTNFKEAMAEARAALQEQSK